MKNVNTPMISPFDFEIECWYYIWW